MRGWIENKITNIWFLDRSTPYLSALIHPVLWLLNRISEPFIRRKSERQGLARRVELPTGKPVVIVIGNLVVGGAGKTPLALALGALFSSRELRVGYLASGYGSPAYEKTQLITHQARAADVGDEASMIYKKSRCPVGVGKNRLEALNLLSQAGDIDVVISDDGLQHEALPRTLEIVVFDDRFVGNAHLLPSGPLREPLSRLASVDVVFAPENRYAEVNKFIDLTKTDLCTSTWHLAGFCTLADYAGENNAQLTNIEEFRDAIGGKELHAIAGMASPQKFLSTLAAESIEAILHSPGDHAMVEQSLLQTLNAHIVVMTEKDAVKYMRWLSSSETDLSHCWVAVGQALLSAHCIDAIWRRVAPHLMRSV
jgi:tetraacyldisaccharide 4'-kinase